MGILLAGLTGGLFSVFAHTNHRLSDNGTAHGGDGVTAPTNDVPPDGVLLAVSGAVDGDRSGTGGTVAVNTAKPGTTGAMEAAGGTDVPLLATDVAVQQQQAVQQHTEMGRGGTLALRAMLQQETDTETYVVGASPPADRVPFSGTGTCSTAVHVTSTTAVAVTSTTAVAVSSSTAVGSTIPPHVGSTSAGKNQAHGQLHHPQPSLAFTLGDTISSHDSTVSLSLPMPPAAAAPASITAHSRSSTSVTAVTANIGAAQADAAAATAAAVAHVASTGTTTTTARGTRSHLDNSHNGTTSSAAPATGQIVTAAATGHTPNPLAAHPYPNLPLGSLSQPSPFAAAAEHSPHTNHLNYLNHSRSPTANRIPPMPRLPSASAHSTTMEMDESKQGSMTQNDSTHHAGSTTHHGSTTHEGGLYAAVQQGDAVTDASNVQAAVTGDDESFHPLIPPTIETSNSLQTPTNSHHTASAQAALQPQASARHQGFLGGLFGVRWSSTAPTLTTSSQNRPPSPHLSHPDPSLHHTPSVLRLFGSLSGATAGNNAGKSGHGAAAGGAVAASHYADQMYNFTSRTGSLTYMVRGAWPDQVPPKNVCIASMFMLQHVAVT